MRVFYFGAILFIFGLAQAQGLPNSVKAQFDYVTLSYWNSTVLTTFKNVIINLTETYCLKRPVQCMAHGNWSKATVPEVQMNIDSPKTVKKQHTEITFHVVAINPNYNQSVVDVEKNVLIDLIKNNSKMIQNSLQQAANLSYEYSFRVSYINGIKIISCDPTTPLIYTPITCVIMLLLVIAIITLAIREKLLKKKEKKVDEKADEMKERKDSDRVGHKNVLEKKQFD